MKCHKETPYVTTLNKKECHTFFSLAKSGNKRAESVLPGRADTNGRGKEVGKGCRKVNVVQYRVHVNVNGKRDTC
jgi:hypothetical protein